MSSKSNDSRNLTTDAFPSPPRENLDGATNETGGENIDRPRTRSKNSKNGLYKNNSGSDDSDHSSSTNDSSNSRREFSSKYHEGFPRPNTFASTASIINISNATGVQIGSNFTYIVKSSKDNLPKRSKHIPKTDKINTLLKSEERITEEVIQFIATHMDEKWVETARFLNYSDGQISQFHCDFIKIALKEVIYQFLLDWYRNEGESATFGKLSIALWKSGQRECVLRWSEKYL